MTLQCRNDDIGYVCTLNMLFGNVPTEQLMRMVLGAVIQ